MTLPTATRHPPCYPLGAFLGSRKAVNWPGQSTAPGLFIQPADELRAYHADANEAGVSCAIPYPAKLAGAPPVLKPPLPPVLQFNDVSHALPPIGCRKRECEGVQFACPKNSFAVTG